MSKNDENVKVHVRCRRGSDVVTSGQICDSIQAYRLTPEGSHNVTFKCSKCGFVWIVPIGGAFNL